MRYRFGGARHTDQSEHFACPHYQSKDDLLVDRWETQYIRSPETCCQSIAATQALGISGSRDHHPAKRADRFPVTFAADLHRSCYTSSMDKYFDGYTVDENALQQVVRGLW